MGFNANLEHKGSKQMPKFTVYSKGNTWSHVITMTLWGKYGFYSSLLVLLAFCLLAILLFVIRFTTSDYPFGVRNVFDNITPSINHFKHKFFTYIVCHSESTFCSGNIPRKVDQTIYTWHLWWTRAEPSLQTKYLVYLWISVIFQTRHPGLQHYTEKAS